MAKAKHTPGPWQYYYDPADHYVHKIRVGAGLVCQMPGWAIHDAMKVEQEANARLIAAAPDLLEALQITRGNIASLGPAGALTPYTSYQEWLAMVDAAIAKALGGQP
ncbi:hypothetical protein [Comamonas aquatica]|uniref:hypothetical protein n=1 Tax=Comamonas aquatica TaxID=225991 RepID=UPI003918F8B6